MAVSAKAERERARAAAAPVESGAAAATPAPSSSTSAAVPAREVERQLRNAFAAEADVLEPALQLAGFLVDKERHREALHVLDVAIERQPMPELQVPRAGLLRDLARNEEATAALRAVVRERGRDGVPAGTLLELAQVEWLAGDGEAARATMADLFRIHADSAFLTENADWIREWHERVQSGSVEADGGELRDAFALLRAAPIVTGRMRMLEGLARPAPDGADDGRRLVRLRAIGIAAADESAAVRARAVQLADSNGLDSLAFWSAAMADRAPLVRRFGAVGAARRHGEAATDALLTAIAREQDADAFLAMHRALGAATSRTPPPCDAGDEGGRAEAVAAWRKLCAR